MVFTYDPANANVRASFATLMKSFPEIKKVFFDEFKMYPEMYSQYLDIDNSQKQKETENAVGGRPIWGTKTEANDYTFGDYAQGTEVAYTHITYADAFDVSEELMEDNQWKNVMKNAREMARGGYAVVEDVSADILNLGFVGGTTGSDGGQLFSATHNLINSASTGDNAMTEALDADALQIAYELADRIVNEANIFVPVDYDVLVIPPELRQAGEELAKSEYTPGDSTNAVNVYKNRIKKIVVNPYLTSATAWFLISSSSEKKGKLFWRVRPQFIDDRDQFSGNFLCKARARFSVGHTEWQGAIGSTGTT
jgi:hypothetical protein